MAATIGNRKSKIENRKSAIELSRLHWTTLSAALIAFVTLFISEGQSFVMPALIIALLASQRTTARLGNNSAGTWMLRILVFGVILTLDTMRPDTIANNFFDFRLNWAGELLAAELVIQLWKRRPEGGARGVVVILLSGLVFLIACDTPEEARNIPYIMYFAPLYMLLLVISMRHYRLPTPPETAPFEIGIVEAPPSRMAGALVAAPWKRQVAYGIALGMALAFGMTGHYAFRYFRVGLTRWGMRMLSERMNSERIGLSTNPQLGPTDNLKGSPARVARISGEKVPSHWRVLAFSKYERGGWGPSRYARSKGEVPATPVFGSGVASRKNDLPASEPLVVRRLAFNVGLLCEPLQSVSFDALDTDGVVWSKEDGGPLQTTERSNTSYSLEVSSNDVFQGPFCAPPDAGERVKLLEVPAGVDPGVRLLARRIAGKITDPRARAAAVENYLISNYRYSQTYHPRGDMEPVSEFLLHNGAAHCEFFAASATILLRCLHIPTRYVVGYYAHEGDGHGGTLIRQRDAHAWAECWIDGVGWITIDGTPGNGRPDQLEDEHPLPAWMRLREWFQDTWERTLDWLKGPQAVKWGVGIGLVAFLVLAWQWKRQWKRQRPARSGEFNYASPSEELARIASRFERVCRSAGLSCPPEFTWLEYVRGTSGQAALQTTGLEAEAVATFVHDYNAARFGPVPDAATLADLNAQLNRLEASISH